MLKYTNVLMIDSVNPIDRGLRLNFCCGFNWRLLDVEILFCVTEDIS